MRNLLGVSGGGVLEGTALASGGRSVRARTRYGGAPLTVGGGYALLFRHHGGAPPHRINHRANMLALSRYAVEVVGVGSVGSLRRGIRPGTLVVPDDYLDFAPPTYHDRRVKHIVPSFDPGLRARILEAARKAKVRVVDSGVYAQTRGPRLETRAEVRLLSDYADVVGMTVASEATLAQELGLGYAAICSVDNMAHGLSGGRFDAEDIKANAALNRRRVEAVLEALAGEGL